MRKSAKGLYEANGLARPDLLPKHSIWFTDCICRNTFIIPEDKPPMGELLSITVEPEITETRVVRTPETVSFEGQMLEGSNLIVDILIRQNIRYSAATPSQSIHIAQFESLERSVVVLPTHYVEASADRYIEFIELHKEGKLAVKAYIEDIHGLVLDSRKIYISTSMFIDVTLKKIGFANQQINTNEKNS